MIFDNGWIDANAWDKLPPLHEMCQVLVVAPDGVRQVTIDNRSQSGRWRYWGDSPGGGQVIAHQPLAAMPTPTPTKPPLVERLLARAACCMTQAMAMEIIGIIDSERAKDTPFDTADMRNLRNCYAWALAYRAADEVAALARAIDRLEVVT